MKESLYIKNFGPLRNVEIETIKPFTVLVGDNGSGKSVLMKLLSLFYELSNFHSLARYIKDEENFKIKFEYYFNELLINSKLEDYFTEKTDISYIKKYMNGKECKYKLKNKQFIYEVNYTNKIILEYNYINFFRDTRNLINYEFAYENGIDDYIHDMSIKFNEIQYELGFPYQMDLPFLGIRYLQKCDEKDRLIVTVSDINGNYEIPFNNCSSAIKNVIYLLMFSEFSSKKISLHNSFKQLLCNNDIINSYKDNIDFNIKKINHIIIEEPELNLFPQVQCELINELIVNSFIKNKNKTRLIFSTHSPYILNHLNLLLNIKDNITAKKITNGAYIKKDDIEVLEICDGKVESLLLKNANLINTNLLSEAINNIYDNYNIVMKNS